MKSLNILRYLTFEINRSCNLYHEHAGKCPISHPERYMFGERKLALTDEVIMDFWRWARVNGFRGIILWHMYNEPTLVIGRVRGLMKRMKQEDPNQPFQLTTNSRPDVEGFDIFKYTDYGGGAKLDNRLATARGEGKPYSEMPRMGLCGRGLGWEIPIDNWGNWCLCCNDWRCEESVGNIWSMGWSELLDRFKDLTERIRWNDEASYNAMPRMCRACLDVNPALHRAGGV